MKEFDLNKLDVYFKDTQELCNELECFYNKKKQSGVVDFNVLFIASRSSSSK